ncbi:hypothetical protein FACS189472_09740 [Alphaproteobacteria bacterium]|nr:hypothetical protein FACS189472_09740 [Alphaproteobacteria bacterium]
MVDIFDRIKTAYNWVKENGKKKIVPIVGKLGDLVQSEMVQGLLKLGAEHFGMGDLLEKANKIAKIASSATDSYVADTNKSIFDIVEDPAGNHGDLGIKGLNRDLISKIGDNAKATRNTINNFQEKGFNKDTLMGAYDIYEQITKKDTLTDKMKSKMEDLKYNTAKTIANIRKNSLGTNSSGIIKASNFIPGVAVGKALYRNPVKGLNLIPGVALGKGLASGYRTLKTV